jgi:hypothetical protein
MKKIVLLILVLGFSLISCSDDDGNSSSETGYYLEVNLLGDTYKDTNIGLFSYNEDECNTNLPLVIQSIGQIEKSNFFIDSFIVHFEDQSDFQGYNVNNSTFWANSYMQDGDCYENLNLIINFELDGIDLNLDTTKNNSNTIKKVSKISESNLEITYSVEGSFIGTFKKSDNTLVELTGKYRLPISTLK